MRRDTAVKARSTRPWSAARANFTPGTRRYWLLGILVAPAFLLGPSSTAASIVHPITLSLTNLCILKVINSFVGLHNYRDMRCDNGALSVAISAAFAGYLPWGKRRELASAVGATMVAPAVPLVLIPERSIVNGLTRGARK